MYWMQRSSWPAQAGMTHSYVLQAAEAVGPWQGDFVYMYTRLLRHCSSCWFHSVGYFALSGVRHGRLSAALRYWPECWRMVHTYVLKADDSVIDEKIRVGIHLVILDLSYWLVRPENTICKQRQTHATVRMHLTFYGAPHLRSSIHAPTAGL